MQPPAPWLDTEIAQHVWATRYRDREAGERGIEDSWQRVARAVAKAEQSPSDWRHRFADCLRGFAFLPGGRILAGAGAAHDATLFSCFVMGGIEDSIEGIFRSLQEGALTMQRGGGVGFDFSTLRPLGAQARSSGAIASGPVSFMQVWDAMCATIQSTGARRGAMMATLRCDHPDIEAFIDAKNTAGRLSNFSLSVQATDDFMQAVAADAAWKLVFPASRLVGEGETVLRSWPGESGPVPCRVVRTMPARALWDRLVAASYAHGSPGVLFVDRINRSNNLWYCEQITATNPCGEMPLPPYGACNLGSINLARLIRDPFTRQAGLDTARLDELAATAVRLLDDVIDVSRFPLPAQRAAVLRARRVGLGVTGLADALIMLGLRYDSEQAVAFAGDAMRRICHAAYRESIAIAAEKGSFPAFEREMFLEAPFIRALPADIRDGIADRGIRNSHLLSVAPTGTISLLAGNVSSGIEPVFAADQQRSVLEAGGAARHFRLTDYAVRLWRKRTGQADALPPALVTVADLSFETHLAMQSAVQGSVDNAIAKTINLHADTDLAAFAPLYRLAYEMGLKGCTTFRPGVAGDVVQEDAPPSEASCGCDVDALPLDLPNHA